MVVQSPFTGTRGNPRELVKPAPESGATTRRLFGILPTFERFRELSITLEALGRQHRKLDHLLVVDNAASEDVAAIVRSYGAAAHRVEYQAPGENLGFAGGVAFGMRRILEEAEDSDWIVLLDDDRPIPSDSTFLELAHFGEQMVSQNPATAVVGLVGARFDWKRGILVRIPDEELMGPVSVDCIGGNHFPFYLTRTIRDVGPFRSEIFFGLSEVEHGLRLRKAGYSIYAHGDLWRSRRTNNSRLDMDHARSWRLQDVNWRWYYSLRNSIFILRSHRRFAAAVRLSLAKGLAKPLMNLPFQPRLACRYLRLNARACVDGWRGRMGRTIEPDGRSRPRS